MSGGFQGPLDHVALVVPDLGAVGAALAPLELPVGPIQEFPSEGTHELYLGRGSARLLLIQPLGDASPYARALTRRGPGLHHVAAHVPDVRALLLETRGWLLHPESMASFERSRTVWLARPGVPTLVELHQSESSPGAPVVESIEIPGSLHDVSPGFGLQASDAPEVHLSLHGHRWSARELALGEPPRS